MNKKLINNFYLQARCSDRTLFIEILVAKKVALSEN